MIFYKKNKGFTLIELLVVIAIIGILATVILVSLDSARSKGSDASIKSNIKTLYTQSQIYFDNNSEYYSSANVFASSNTTTCTFANTVFADSVVSKAVSAIIASNPTGSRLCVIGTVSAGSSLVNSWAAVFPLVENPNTFWCVDSSGVSRSKNSNGVAYSGTTTGTAALSNTSDTTCN